jgi:hypothetical protein
MMVDILMARGVGGSMGGSVNGLMGSGMPSQLFMRANSMGGRMPQRAGMRPNMMGRPGFSRMGQMGALRKKLK